MMTGWIAPGILIAAGTWLSEVGAEIVLATLAGAIFVARPSYGIEFWTGYAIERRRQLRCVRFPVILDLVAELVELLDALRVGAKGALVRGGPSCKNPKTS